jgi:ABC-type Zn uptake system ZnuABC Zn-binding protein ZnuA
MAIDNETIRNAENYKNNYDAIQDKINELNTKIGELTEQIEVLKSGAYDYYEVYGQCMSSNRFKDIHIEVEESVALDTKALMAKYADWAKRFPTKVKSPYSYIKTNANNAKVKQKQ